MLTFLVRTCCDWYDNRITSSTPFLLRVSVRGRVFFVMLLKEARDGFLFDCECRHLAKGAIRNYRAETKFPMTRVYLQIRRSMERHSRAEEFPSGLCVASAGEMICCMACSRKLSSREATGALLKTGRRYLCNMYE